ncbi:ribosomal subunit Interface protein [Rubrivivax gelatinosus]|uniref:Ribosomal subunit Interface protein n=1 Tax=Rubrivivax gelatinosus TaxID=28068 RepID=A0ABS1DUP9_RUBGE|nr:HPF/RaiA family ribosome-associated protein [Rubrivivax gelatinosus]MBK1613479.1 ribosomal subunit Interface protein [Rubrivivax gelatinosus]MBK1713208.1 ribosomal subunit Interface protein [Rubrivivax gelatinosus]
MQVQVNTDNHIQNDEALAAWIEREIVAKLDRFGDAVTRIEVHLADTNAGRSSDSDKRCTLEARPAGRPPVAASHDAGRVADAFSGALDKLVRVLDSTLGKARDHGRDSIRGA